MKSLAAFWARDSPAGFLVRFVTLGSLAFGVYAFPFELFGVQQDWLGFYLAGYAKMAGALLGLFEHGIVVNGNLIQGRFPLQIVRTCDAAEISILFATAVLAFPAPWRAKLLAPAAGLPCLVVANLIRICSLYFIGLFKPSWFKVGHEEVWPLLLVAFVAFVFARATRFMTKPKINLEIPANG